MDEKDKKILSCLLEHGRWSVQKIAKATRIPITTVYHRMKHLEEEGIIRKYTIAFDHKKRGLPLAAYVLVFVDYKELKEQGITQHDLVQQFVKEKEVEEAAMVTGDMDIILKIRADHIDTLNQFITLRLRGITGVERTQTMLILNEVEK